MSAVEHLEQQPGYHTVAHQYHQLGWAPLPLPRGQKASPPTGTTGADGKWPTADDIDAWAATNTGNIALRLPPTVIGIDVDDYDGKDGGGTLTNLEGQYGTLPPTWVSTSRGNGTSGIRLYRIPDGVRLPGVLGPGIDVIQHHHRYMVVTPSTHPSGGRYRLYDPSGNRAVRPPSVDELPELPTAWLDQLRLDKTPTPIADTPRPTPVDQDSIAERINNDHDWHQVLVADGWTLHQHRNGETHWTRPGKTDGTSAILHEPGGPFVVFSTSMPALQHGWAERDGHWSYSLFGYLAATRHHGNRSDCARTYRQQLNAVDAQLHTFNTAPAATAALDGTSPDIDTYAHLVDWRQFWTSDHTDEDWLAYPLIPRGRSIALYAPAKAGKSTIVLSAIAALATGNSIWGNPPASPAHVLYLDYEMTEADLMERLVDLGYGPDDNLEHLHYALLPSLPPLDTPAGAHALLNLAEHCHAQLVVVDTFGRAVAGDEDKADTVRAFYRHTGLALKAKGIAVLRTDHAGKDVDRGQRGSSAKADDVDVVWSLKRNEGGVQLTRTHSRVSWGPSELLIHRIEDGGTTTYRTLLDEQYPAGTKDIVKHLDTLNVPIEASARKAAQALRDAGHKARNDVVRAAQQARRKRPNHPPRPVDNHGSDASKARPARFSGEPHQPRPAHWGAPRETLENTGPTAPGALGRTLGDERGAQPLTSKGRAPRSPRQHDLTTTQIDPDELF